VEAAAVAAVAVGAVAVAAVAVPWLRCRGCGGSPDRGSNPECLACEARVLTTGLSGRLVSARLNVVVTCVVVNPFQPYSLGGVTGVFPFGRWRHLIRVEFGFWNCQLSVADVLRSMIPQSTPCRSCCC
jgi:hypothetical protein